MTTQNLLLGPIGEGLRKDSKPAFSPEDSFEVLTNAYQWRGRIVKRSGYTTLGRLSNGTPVMGLRTQENFGIGLQTLIAFDTTDSYLFNGTNFVPLPSVMPVTWSGTDSQFFWTINYANSFWATNNKAGLNGYTVSQFTNQAGAGPWTVDVNAAGNNFQAGDEVYFVNVTGAAAANNLRSGVVTVSGNPFTITSATGGAFTNGAVTSGMVLSSTRSRTGQDGIRYYGILSNGTGWANYNPPIDPNNALAGCLLMFAYRGYLVFLSTWEGNEQVGVKQYPNRARWTQIGTPYYTNPVPVSPNTQSFDARACRDDLFGRGGANDAPTNEVIVSAGFIRDILVVKFERSTWRLRFVNNAQNPFVWERVNVELGSDCTFSSIIFDKGLMNISQRGINISDGNDTIRFDEKIPDDIFDIRQSNEGLQRVYGIRTFRTRLNYWTFPTASKPNGIYPDSVLVFNYDTKNWSFFDDSFTCFGYYYTIGTPVTWGDLTDAWSSYTNITWDSGVGEVGYENIVAGNQQGYVLLLEQTDGENGPSLAISAITNGTPPATPSVITSNNHNLTDGNWITLSGVTGTTSTDGVSLNGRNFKISDATQNANTFSLNEFKSIAAGNAVGTSFSYTIGYKNIQPGSIQINIGALSYFDRNLDGLLYQPTSTTSSGSISYNSGLVNITFSPAILSTPVYIRCVSLDPAQGLTPVFTSGVYGGGGEIAKISNLDIQTKIYQFFKDDKRARLSKIDFYTNLTTHGQFTCNVFADASNEIINTPLSDNPLSNIVLTTKNPYQYGIGDQTIYRLFCDAIAQTIQLQLTYSDYQMAINAITQSDLEIVAMIASIRQGGRLV